MQAESMVADVSAFGAIVESARSAPWTSSMGTELVQQARVVKLSAAGAERLRRDFHHGGSVFARIWEGNYLVEARTCSNDPETDRGDLDEWGPHDAFASRSAACHHALSTLSREIGGGTSGILEAWQAECAANARVATAQAAFEAARERRASLVLAGNEEWTKELKRHRILGKARRNEADPDLIARLRADVLDRCGPAIEAAKAEETAAESALNAAKAEAAAVRRGDLSSLRRAGGAR